MDDDELIAANFTGTLWAAISGSGGPRHPARHHRHFPGAYDAKWASQLRVPIDDDRPTQQPVTLLDDETPWEKHTDNAKIAKAYAHRPRTRVYTDAGIDRPSDWFAKTALHVQRLTHSTERVTCSIFESRHGDRSIAAHQDTWYGAIVQLRGRKVWRIGHALLEETSPQPIREVITRAGDILLIPKMLPHAVDTPDDPGYSVHLTYAIDRDAHPVKDLQEVAISAD